ncbi:MAG: DUF4393 domain-containing protein [Bacteroidales bacterium]|nr:DUF4393 domain-containing protein [Bacteroidales bacterium]
MENIESKEEELDSKNIVKAEASIVEVSKPQKVINIALAPISGLIWGFDKINDFLNEKLEEKLKNVPEENIITPDPHVVGPALESLRFTGNNEELREMFANLIANSMDVKTVTKAHPGFVEIIKNLTSDEGLILKSFMPNEYEPIIDAKLKIKVGDGGEHNLLENYSLLGKKANCKHQKLVPNYIDNLCRLGLLQIPSGRHIVGKNAYDKLIETSEFKAFQKQHESEHTTVVIHKKYIALTNLGVLFREACIIDKK